VEPSTREFPRAEGRCRDRRQKKLKSRTRTPLSSVCLVFAEVREEAKKETTWKGLRMRSHDVGGAERQSCSFNMPIDLFIQKIITGSRGSDS